MMRSSSQVPLWVVVGILGNLLLICMVAIFAGFGASSYFNPSSRSIPRQPAFFRSSPGNCNDGFICVNASDPNPSYLQWNTPPFTNSIFTQEYSDVQDVFDISDPETVRILKDGVYGFTIFTPFFSPLGDGEAASVMTQNEYPILQSPAIGGDLGKVVLLTLFQDGIGNISAALFSYAGTGIYLTKGTELRVAYKVSLDMLITPGSYWSGFRISDLSI